MTYIIIINLLLPTIFVEKIICVKNHSRLLNHGVDKKGKVSALAQLTFQWEAEDHK